MRNLILLVFICLLIVINTFTISAIKVTEYSLNISIDNVKNDSMFSISPNYYWAAYTKKIGINQVCVVLNGKQGKPYDSIRGYANNSMEYNDKLVISRDGMHIGFQASRDGKWLICKDNIEGKLYVDVSPPIFSENGEGMIYKARSGDKWCVVFNGQESLYYNKIGSMNISSDGCHYAFNACNNDEGLVSTVIDNTPLPARQGKIDSLIIFSPNSKRVLTICGGEKDAVDGGGEYVMVNGQVGKKYSKIESPKFTVDSLHYYYMAVGEGIGNQYAIWDKIESQSSSDIEGLICNDNSMNVFYIMDRQYIIHNGCKVIIPKGNLISCFQDGSPAWKFSSDAKHYYCIIKQNKEQVAIVIDGVKGPDYDGISDVQMSMDGEHIAYIASRSGKMRVVYDGKESSLLFTNIDQLTLSPDGKRIAYVGLTSFLPDRKCTMVVDDIQYGFNDGTLGKPYFSPDSKNIAYKMKVVNWETMSFTTRIVVNGKEGKAYIFTTDPTFSSDSKHIAYFAEGDKDFCVVDNQETPGYERIWTVTQSKDSNSFETQTGWGFGEFAKPSIRQPVMDTNHSLHFFTMINKVYTTVNVEF